MKCCARLVFALVLASLVACQSRAPEASPPSVAVDAPSVSSAMPFDFAWDDRSPFRGGLIPSEQSALEGLAGASVYHMDLQIADDLVHLTGRQDVRYTNQETVPLDGVYFRLYPNLFGGSVTIHAVQVNDRDVGPAYELADSAVRVPLSPALGPGEQAVIKIAFSVTVPTEGGGNYGVFAFLDGVLALAHFYPMIPVYDDEGWNLEIPPEQGDVVYADSSFYLVRVTAPADLTLVASGVEVERQGMGDRQQVTFAGGPMRDFYLAGSKRYTAVSEQVGETRVNGYVLEGFAREGKTVLRFAVNALKVFNDRFGVYPFTEFDVVGTPTQAYGVEYPGVVAIALRLYDPTQRENYPLPYLESTVAHEVGHQWFYSVVGNDQLDEPWVDEAVVQYATLLYWLDLYGAAGASGFRESLYGRWDQVARAEIPIGLPVRDYKGREYGAIVYGRGPLFLEELSKKLGRGTFDAFLRDYYEVHKWGIATADSLKGLAEIHCDCDLTPMFADWVYGQ